MQTQQTIDLFKRFEQALLILGRNTNARVRYFEAQQHISPTIFNEQDADSDITLGCKLNRVAGEIEENLAKT